MAWTETELKALPKEKLVEIMKFTGRELAFDTWSKADLIDAILYEQPKKMGQLIPKYTPDNPQPLEDILADFAPPTLVKLISVHKDDGTICVFPWCRQTHDEYEVVYERKKIKKIIDPKEL